MDPGARPAILAIAALLSAAAPAPHAGPAPGRSAPPVDLGELSLSALRGRPVVLVFLSARCPLSGAYAGRLASLAREHAGRATFVGIDSGPASALEAREYSARKRFGFPVYKDEGRAVADRYGVVRVPEVFVLDASGVVRYRGRIDNSQDESRVERRELKDALAAVLAGAAPPVAQTPPMGCGIR